MHRSLPPKPAGKPAAFGRRKKSARYRSALTWGDGKYNVMRAVMIVKKSEGIIAAIGLFGVLASLAAAPASATGMNGLSLNGIRLEVRMSILPSGAAVPIR
jgi:hypothetical protein